VTQLPGSGVGETVGNLGAGIGAQVANQVVQRAAQSGAQAALPGVAAKAGGLGASAAGALGSVGIGIGTSLLADKIRKKEEMPTFGGANADYLDQYGRRFEGTGGGLASNAVRYAGYGSAAGPIGAGVGALAGLIKGAASNNAPSAYTDFRVEDASQAIKDIYGKELGRAASDDEVLTHLKNVGFDPTGGDRWAGEKSTNYILDQIRASPEAQAFRGGNAAVGGAAQPAGADPLGAGGADPLAGRVGAVAPTAAADLAGRVGQTGALSTGTSALASKLSGNTGPLGPPMVDTDGDGVKDTAVDPKLSVEAEQPAGAAAAAAPDRSGWDTDGYTPPAYVPPQAGAVPAGWDATKWNDPNHQTPKYGVGRILSTFPPTVEGLKAAMPDIERAYPGTTFNGKDKITVPGVGPVDVLEAAGQGGKAWRWGADDTASPLDAGGAAPTNALVDASGGPSNQADVLALIQSLMQGQGAPDQASLTKTLLNQVRG
jgi:hypothetical protein